MKINLDKSPTIHETLTAILLVSILPLVVAGGFYHTLNITNITIASDHSAILSVCIFLGMALFGLVLYRKYYINPVLDQLYQAEEKTRKQQSNHQLQLAELQKTLQFKDKTIEHQQHKNLHTVTSLARSREETKLNLNHLHHEIRTPLSGIVAAVEMVEQVAHQATVKAIELKFASGLSPQARELIANHGEYREIHTILEEILKPSASLMENTLDHLLQSLRNIDNDSIKVLAAPFPVNNLVSSALKSFQKLAEDKGLRFDSSITNNTPVALSQLYYHSDIARIGQVLSILLSNAVRFTQSGAVQLRVDIDSMDNSERHRLIFIIKDSGCGIQEELATAIFKLFNTTSDASRIDWEGMGTGLPLCRKIADALGGQLSLVSTAVDQGSEFVFELTLPLSAPNHFPEDSSPDSNGHAISLLYVEDSKTNRSVFKQYCDRADINLQLAVDGLDGWNKYRSFEFDALVVDCWMPHKNGFELVKDIRQFEQDKDLPRIPIFALTADPTPETRQRCTEVGFDEFLTKPYKMDTFNFIIERTEALSEADIIQQELI